MYDNAKQPNEINKNLFSNELGNQEDYISQLSFLCIPPEDLLLFFNNLKQSYSLIVRRTKFNEVRILISWISGFENRFQRPVRRKIANMLKK